MSSRMYAGFAGAALVIASLFMPFFSREGIEMNGLQLIQLMGFPTFFFIICGIVIFCISVVKNRWLNLINILTGIICALLAIQYQSEVINMGGSKGIGTWVLLIGGIIAALAGVLGVLHKNRPATENTLSGLT